jgi:hypothetical protein
MDLPSSVAAGVGLYLGGRGFVSESVVAGRVGEREGRSGVREGSGVNGERAG